MLLTFAFSLFGRFSSGVSRCFAFAKFTSVEHARQFMERNYPYITLGDSRVKIDYSRNSEGGFDEGWTCKSVSRRAILEPMCTGCCTHPYPFRSFKVRRSQLQGPHDVLPMQPLRRSVFHPLVRTLNTSPRRCASTKGRLQHQ